MGKNVAIAILAVVAAGSVGYIVWQKRKCAGAGCGGKPQPQGGAAPYTPGLDLTMLANPFAWFGGGML